MPALLKDKRVLAAFKDPAEKPITVSDVAEAVQRKFFHGADLAIQEKRVNDHTEKVFEAMLMKRILSKEAKARGIHGARRLPVAGGAERELRWCSDASSDVAIKPSVRVDESEVQAYYETHKDGDYTNPELVTLDSIAFPDTAKAQAAFDKIRAGADFDWMKVNGDGIVSEESRTPELKGRTVTKSSMPQPLAKAIASALARANTGSYSTAGPCYVVKVARQVPAEVRPFEAVEERDHQEALQQRIS